jgi:cell division protein FtsI/penicillin-binding protein 2
MDWRMVFRGRSTFFLVLVLFWLAAIVWQLLHFMVLDREAYLREFRDPSWRTGTLPALRGRLLSESGKPLAWSTRYFVLVYNVPDDPQQVERDLFELRDKIEIADTDWDAVRRSLGQTRVLRGSLSPDEIVAVEPVVERVARLHVQNRFRRHYANDDPQLLGLIGTTRMISNMEIGVSGWEKQFNDRLRGQDGKYRVMVDKHGAWILETWQELYPPVAGYDVYIPSVQ